MPDPEREHAPEMPQFRRTDPLAALTVAELRGRIAEFEQAATTAPNPQALCAMRSHQQRMQGRLQELLRGASQKASG